MAQILVNKLINATPASVERLALLAIIDSSTTAITHAQIQDRIGKLDDVFGVAAISPMVVLVASIESAKPVLCELPLNGLGDVDMGILLAVHQIAVRRWHAHEPEMWFVDASTFDNATTSVTVNAATAGEW